MNSTPSLTSSLEAAASFHPGLDDFNFFNGDLEQIELCGTARHLTNQGVAVGDFSGERPYEDRFTILGSDGQAWDVWGTDPFGMKARRPRTEAERVRWIDHQNARVTTSYFSKDRQVMLREIGFELYRIASELVTDRPMARAARRLLKKKLAVFASVQLALNSQIVDMPELRAHLASVGLVIPQIPYLH